MLVSQKDYISFVLQKVTEMYFKTRNKKRFKITFGIYLMGFRAFVSSLKNEHRLAHVIQLKYELICDHCSI